MQCKSERQPARYIYSREGALRERWATPPENGGGEGGSELVVRGRSALSHRLGNGERRRARNNESLRLNHDATTGKGLDGPRLPP